MKTIFEDTIVHTLLRFIVFEKFAKMEINYDKFCSLSNFNEKQIPSKKSRQLFYFLPMALKVFAVVSKVAVFLEELPSCLVKAQKTRNISRS